MVAQTRIGRIGLLLIVCGAFACTAEPVFAQRGLAGGLHSRFHSRRARRGNPVPSRLRWTNPQRYSAPTSTNTNTASSGRFVSQRGGRFVTQTPPTTRYYGSSPQHTTSSPRIRYQTQSSPGMRSTQTRYYYSTPPNTSTATGTGRAFQPSQRARSNAIIYTPPPLNGTAVPTGTVTSGGILVTEPAAPNLQYFVPNNQGYPARTQRAPATRYSQPDPRYLNSTPRYMQSQPAYAHPQPRHMNRQPAYLNNQPVYLAPTVVVDTPVTAPIAPAPIVNSPGSTVQRVPGARIYSTRPLMQNSTTGIATPAVPATPVVVQPPVVVPPPTIGQ